MSATPEQRREFRSKIALAAFFLATAVSVAFKLPYIYRDFSLSDGSQSAASLATEIAATVSPLVYLCGCIYLFLHPRVGYGLGLTASLLALPWFIQIERYSHASAWTVFNLAPDSAQPDDFTSFEVLIILSVGLIVVSAVCATIQVLPVVWIPRWFYFLRSIGLGVLSAVLVLGAWLYHVGTPYTQPMIVDGAWPIFRILHVEKRGFHFNEVSASVFRDGRIFISRTDRNLFQYEFKTRHFQGSMPYQQVQQFRASAELSGLRTAPPRLLRAWHAEGWYMVRDNSPVLAFTSEYRTMPPRLVMETFSAIQKVPAVALQTEIERDVCLGFCYGPMASLGFKYLNSRLR